MNANLNVTSEIGRLKKVLVHRPGEELLNLTPKWLKQLLFDDIPWLDLAQKEHDAFADIFRKAGVDVVYLVDLVAETLKSEPSVKQAFIDDFIAEASIMHPRFRKAVKRYLQRFDNIEEMIAKTMAGIRETDLGLSDEKILIDYIHDYPFVTAPMPNLYFTRDPFAVLGHGVLLSRMYSQTRRRETLYAEYIFKHHPVYGHGHTEKYYDRHSIASIEGGDLLVLNKHTLAVGISQRTLPSAIEKLATNVFNDPSVTFDTVLALDIPKSRAYMHLDTVITQVDRDLFLMHNEIQKTMKAFELTQKDDHSLKVRPIEGSLDWMLSSYLNDDVTLLPCGGDDVVAASREQWNDGANTIAIAPREVIVYERNHVTNRMLEKHGVNVHTMPSSELSRGRGGPRCMSMPFIRDDME